MDERESECDCGESSDDLYRAGGDDGPAVTVGK